MAVEVKQWMATDGTLFCDREDAESYEQFVEKIELIEYVLKVDSDKAIEIEDFIKKYTQGWKE